MNEDLYWGAVDDNYIVVSRNVDDTSSFGALHVVLRKDGYFHIKAFKEKTGVVEKGLINAGIYVMTAKGFLQDCKDFGLDETKPCSIEKDIFPKMEWLFTHIIYRKNNWSDCGTPERVTEASKWLK